MPDRAWYYAREGKQRGPVNSAELKQLVANGQLSPTDLVWRESMESWAPASSVKGLFAPAVQYGAAGGSGISTAAAVEARSAGMQSAGAQSAEAVGTATASAAAPQVATATIHSDKSPTQVAQAGSLAREASRQALSAFKRMAVNPVGEIGNAFEQLGRTRAMQVGVVFLATSFLCYILARLIGEPSLPIAASVEGPVKRLLFALLILAGCMGTLIGVSALFRRLMQRPVGFEADLFVVGAALLPISFLILLMSLLNPSRPIMAFGAVLSVFAGATLVLMLFAGLTKIMRFSEGMASVIVPTMIASAAAVVWLIGWFFS